MGDDPRHTRGYAGEQHMGFFLGANGYYFVEGPSGAAGHSVTGSGFDGIAYDPKTSQLIIYDNKAFARAGNVGKATAIDPSENLGKNLAKLIEKVQTLHEMPNQARILNLLRQAGSATAGKQKWPNGVRLAVSNASGRSTGVGTRLANAGVQFINVYQAPKPGRVQTIVSRQVVMGALGQWLGAGLQWLGDIGIQREVRKRLGTNLNNGVQAILSRGDGVLVVIALQEWEQPDFNGNRARLLLDVHIQGGKTQPQAEARWNGTPRLLRGPSKGWRVTTQFGWIPPVTP